jgi:hypothetical protein
MHGRFVDAVAKSDKDQATKLLISDMAEPLRDLIDVINSDIS